MFNLEGVTKSYFHLNKLWQAQYLVAIIPYNVKIISFLEFSH